MPPQFLYSTPFYRAQVHDTLVISYGRIKASLCFNAIALLQKAHGTTKLKERGRQIKNKQVRLVERSDLLISRYMKLHTK